MYEEERIKELEASLGVLRTRGWTQGRYVVPSGDGQVCAMGANRVSLDLPYDKYGYPTYADAELYRVLPLWCKFVTRSIQAIVSFMEGESFSKVGGVSLYNDAPWRRQRGVERLFQRAIRRLVWQKRRRILGENVRQTIASIFSKKVPEKVPEKEQLVTMTVPLSEWMDVAPLEPLAEESREVVETK